REEAVREIGHEVPDLREAEGSVEKHEQDRACPAFADELNCSVIESATFVAARYPLLLGPRNLLGLSCCRAGGHAPVLEGQAACDRRASSIDPSRGRSPALVTRFVKVARATCATASSTCSSDQSASRASSRRYAGGAPSDSSSAFRKRSSVAS